MAKENEEVERIHVLVFKADAEWLRDTYESTIGISKAVRMMIRNTRDRLEERKKERAA